VQAKTKTQGKAIKALSGEIDAAKLIVHTFEKEIADELKSHSSALKSLEDKLTTELALGLQAARDAASGLESRVSGLEAGRTTILDKIYTQVDANRAKDVERARETMERIEGLQRAVDACVEMCQSDLQDVHEGLESVEQRLDREAEGLEALMERTTRQLTNALDSKLQESMGKV
jgi:chromosome segregation ATPase